MFSQLILALSARRLNRLSLFSLARFGAASRPDRERFTCMEKLSNEFAKRKDSTLTSHASTGSARLPRRQAS